MYENLLLSLQRELNLMPMRKLFFVLLSFFSIHAFSQQMSISGTVMAQGEQEPIIGANVIVQGSNKGTITDFDGQFTLSVNKGDVLVFSYIGYKPLSKTITSDAPLQIILQPDNVMLDEVVAVGYGTMKKSDLTGAVTTVKADELLKAPVAGVDQALQGRAAGVTVVTNSGQPGEAATIRIRGIGSAMNGNDPLYVVDGVITNDISFLAAQDIKSMEVLKDASSAAIYGSRGANGVILISTKTGRDSGTKPTISFDAYWGLQNRWKKLDLITDSRAHTETMLGILAMQDGAEQIGAYYNNDFAYWLKNYKLGKSEYYPTNFDYSAQNTDWQDEVFVKNAFMHNYNLSIDGGSDKGHYAFSAGYFGQNGTIIGSNYERVTLRLNTDFAVRKWWTIGEHLSFKYSTGRNAMNNSSSAGASILSGALAMAPWDPVYYPQGSVNINGKDISGNYSAGSNFKNVTNPFQMAYNTEPNNKSERVVGDLYMEFKPIEGLVIRPSISADYTLARDRSFAYPNTYTSYNYSENNYVGSNMGRYCSLLEETTATYAREIKKHKFSIMVGQTWQEYNTYSIGGSGANILDTDPSNWYLSNTTTDKTESSDAVSRIRRLSFLGRAFYNYDNRYMVTVNFRADASSRFTKNPWGIFPSAALAWRISEEPWVKGKAACLDNLKVRAGWGQVGNDGVGSNAFQQTMTTGTLVFTDYPLGVYPQEVIPGAAVLTLVNMDGKWETNEQWDAGVDFSFWNAKLFGSVDYFRRNTLDALMNVIAPAQVGNMYPLVKNVGNIRNEGVEITLNHENKVGKVHYNIGGNISYIKNTLTDNNGGSPLWGDRTKTDIGMPVGSFWGYKYEGVYQSDEEALQQLTAYTKETIGVHAGDARYADLNGDGKINEDDQTFIGNPFPKLTYGINAGADFYGVDIQLFFQGVYGNQIYNALRERTESSGATNLLASYMKDQAWIGYNNDVQVALMMKGLDVDELENRKGTIPNPCGASTNNANSSRFVEDGSYFRLKNVQIGYTFPKAWTDKFHCSRLRLYVTASNLFTITKYSGYDPEVGGGVDYGNYPQSRTFTFGLNVNF